LIRWRGRSSVGEDRLTSVAHSTRDEVGGFRLPRTLSATGAEHSALWHHRAVPAIAATSEFTVTERRSRFVALAAPASTMGEAEQVVAARRKRHHKARHHCWACRVRDDDGRLVEQARDDGEVGRPGMILLEQLRRADLEGVIVVSRFFGGVKLGPAGVGRAFRAAGEGALSSLV
jgi:putative IMPACT (imprinted ancient) family translation regulator